MSICLLTYLTSYLARETFLNITKEDGVFEYLTAIFFFMTAIGFLVLFFSKKHFKSESDSQYFYNRKRKYFFLLMAVVFIFGAGEEISWGQRLIGFETPAKMHELNVQEEFNFHNLEIFNIKSKEGIRKTGLAKLFTMKQLFLGSFLVYLILVPILTNRFEYLRKLFTKLFIPIPDIWIGIIFILNYGLYRFIRIIRPWDLQWALTEVQEFNFSLILFLLPFIWLSLSRTALSSHIS
jgi:hypothetical protein